MQAVVFHEYGEPAKVLEPTTRPEPGPPGERQVLVRTTRLPIHSGDIIAVNGLHNPRKYAIPEGGLVPGAEGSGVVEKLGPGVDGSRGLGPGVRVSFFAVGAWQERLVLPVDQVFVIPEGMDDDLASQLYVNPMAAMLISREVDKAAKRETGRLRVAATRSIISDGQQHGKKSFVLLSAAGSITAKLIAALLKEKGYTPIALVRSKAGAPKLTATTGTQAIATEDTNWKDQVRNMVGEEGRIIAALDAVGGPLSTELLDLVAPGGTLLSYGILSGEPLIIPQAPLTMENKLVYGVGMIHWTLLPYEDRAADLATVTDFLKRNRHLLPTCGEFKLSEVNHAVESFSQPGRSGIIFLSP